LITPAFLGRADQSSEWRTPPIKALIRQWWRVVVAARYNWSWEAVREAEGVVFGHAWLKKNNRQASSWAMRSPVVLRITPSEESTGAWRPGGKSAWEGDPKVFHPEAGKGPNGMNVGSHLYLGYGPLTYRGGGTALKTPPALAEGELVVLRIAFPEHLKADEFSDIDVGTTLGEALALIHVLGTIGGRSRNGWGSLELLNGDAPFVKPGREQQLVEKYGRPLDSCLELEWPHAIGRDDKGLLVWKTTGFPSWEKAIQELARIKIAFRTKLEPKGVPFPERLALAYPVTHHQLHEWGNHARLANQIRFKVREDPSGGFVGWILHIPHGIPGDLRKKLPGQATHWLDRNLKDVWKKVHQTLDAETNRAWYNDGS